jgi:RNA polymerase sigma-70 factor (sigma-E family)
MGVSVDDTRWDSWEAAVGGREVADRVDDAAHVIGEVFAAQYPALVRLAAMLLSDPHAAEDIVQDAYVRVAARRYRVRDPDQALAYLRQTVVNLARNSLRRRLLIQRHSTVSLSDEPSAEADAIARFEQQQVIRDLRSLSRRHREVVVLRYYLDCSIEETADLLGLSTGAVKAYASRALQQLKAMGAERESGHG